MASGRLTTCVAETGTLRLQGERIARRTGAGAALAIIYVAIGLGGACASGLSDAKIGSVTPAADPEPPCTRPVYLTLDTGHMEIAPFVADVLRRQQVRVTFFGANEATKAGDGSLGRHWAGWWAARAAEGHAFASHTFDHAYWRSDVPPAAPGQPRQFRIRPSAGPREGQEFVVDAAGYCQQIGRASHRLREITGQRPLPLFRAPGGKTSPGLLSAARQCGYAHVGWAAAGFLGDELPSERYSNPALLQKALASIRPGDILIAHLGIWSRADPWAPANLEPLIVGLKQRGMCFATLRQHPDYRAWIAAHG